MQQPAKRQLAPTPKTSGNQTIRLKVNQPITLTDPNKMWLVREGGLEILSTRLEDGIPLGARRHLFRVSERRAVFGCDPADSGGHLGFMAVATENATLVEYDLTRVAASLVARRNGQDLIDTWVREMCGTLTVGRERPSTSLRVDDVQAVSLANEEIFEGHPRHCSWIRVQEGTLRVLGLDYLELTAEQGFVLVAPDLWLQVASESAAVGVFPMPGPGVGSALTDGLRGVHGLVNVQIERDNAREEQAEIERREAGRELQQLQSEGALHEISSILAPRERFKRGETPLLTSLGVIGQVMGMNIKPPAASEDMSRVRDPLEAIARASRIRWRMVLLSAEWWMHDTGPLLGYLGSEERKPVALLPVRGGYEIVDPDRRYREPLTPELRDELCADAYMLYRSLPDRLTGVGDLLKFTARGRVGEMLFIVALGVSATLLGMITPKVTGALIDTAIPNADRNLLYQFAVILTVAGVAGAVFTYVQVMTTVRTGIHAEIIAQSAMWDRLLKFRPDFFRKYSSGDLQTRVNAVSEISRELNAATLRPMISGVLALLNFFLLWYYSWELAKIAIWLGVLVLLVSLTLGHFIRRMSVRLNDVMGSLNGLVIQVIGGVGKLRVAGSEQRAFNHWLLKYSEQLRLTLNVQTLKDLMHIFNLALPPVASALLFWKATDLTVGLPITDPSRITIGNFIAFNTAFVLYLTGWSDVSNTLVNVLDTLVKGKRIQPILDGSPEVSKDASDPGRLTGDIRAEGITFRYSEDGPLVLDDVAFHVRPGEYIAFVGPSGSGKSTILRILLGFERPSYGRILYDGQDLASLDVLAVRRQIGSVLQNGRLNAANILENISNNANISHAEIWDAAADAGMSEDIERMPMGLHTMVSEGGTNLSGGQRQRLLIARALATRPRIVMFDEATSALDNKTQAIVSEALDRRRVSRIVIAHRLSTIRQADRIYVLDRGKIVQVGSFKILSQQEGLFRELMSRQMV